MYWLWQFQYFEVHLTHDMCVLFMFVCSRKVDLQPMHATLKNVTVLSNKQAWQSAFHEQNIWLISAKVQSNRI